MRSARGFLILAIAITPLRGAIADDLPSAAEIRVTRAVCRRPNEALAMLVDRSGGELAAVYDGKRWRPIEKVAGIGLRHPSGFLVEHGGVTRVLASDGKQVATLGVPGHDAPFFHPLALVGLDRRVWLAGEWAIETENDEFFVDDRVLVSARDKPTIEWLSTGVRASKARGKLHVSGLDGTSDADVWAVGGIAIGSAFTGAVLHYDGSKWTRLPTTTPYPFTGVFARKPNEVWIYGGSPLLRTAALYLFDGKQLLRKPIAAPIAAMCADDAGVLWQVSYEGRFSRLELPPAD
jgi:hypothetical protein